MSFALKIKDETSSGHAISEGVVQFPVERITVKELIEARVHQEVKSYNTGTSGPFARLVQPDETEKMLNGVGLPQKRKIDAEKQKSIAISAFQTSGFFLLVNEKHVTELDDFILITPKTVVSFLRLVPLVGG